jgi:2,4-dienoyl-CoA reductase-like NADH-dependent reductase (Old Yellow Enzyme family)
MSELAHVLTSIRIGKLEIKNRVVRTAHGTNLGGGTLSDDLIAYHEARARGGVGLSMLEASGIHPSGPMTLNAWDDAIISRYEALMRAVRPHGMRVFPQLNHLGSELGRPGERPWSASEFASPGLAS